ncbi:hypothetical protein BKA66DRAFT_439188 [Pyrenochaeta sp. MPI-SDFR-AT-0127]|nr:hypothetical protein BKA66DRAFT_439188 [Pyrenochaeta sp. MPI-SDFR-AT-0127]
MRFAVTGLLLASSMFSVSLAQERDDQVAASWEVSGTCAYFFKQPLKWSPLKETCIKYCEKNGGHGYSECDHSPYKDIDIEKDISSQIKRDDAGDPWVVCECKCSNPDVEGIVIPIFEIVAEGLSHLDNIICAVMLEAFKTILDVGIMLVPGGAPVNAAMKAVQGAKSFVENGMEAADFFGNWVGKACGVPEWNFDLWGALIGAPDSMGTSIGCKKKNKSECKKMDSIPEPTKKPEPTKNPDPPKETTKPAPDKPSSTMDPSPSPSPSSCGTAPGAQNAPSCGETSCSIEKPDTGEEDALLRRNSRRRMYRMMLEKRDKKKGKPCPNHPEAAYKSLLLESFDYPSNGKLDANVEAYGWNEQNDYCDYSWQSGTKRNTGKKSKYDSEHVMEWQIVTDFFAKMYANGGTKYSHPDPARGNQSVDYCTYWIESWNFDPQQSFSIDNGPALTPFQHIASVYPSNKNHKAEMIALQKNINSPAKANLFNDNTPTVWSKDEFPKLIVKDRYKVLERLRLLLGAKKYLTETKVKDIFKAQKERMGAILDKLDTEMSVHPREKVDPVTGKTTKYYAWKKQDLLTEWNSHMDTKWQNAVQKYKTVMDTYTNDLDKQHCQNLAKKPKADKDFCERLKKLLAQEKLAPAFSKPW